MERERIVVIGAGLAGGKAVLELRRLGFGGAVELIGAEEHIPYERPPLSKGYLAGRPYSSYDLLPSRRWYADQDVTLRLCGRIRPPTSSSAATSRAGAFRHSGSTSVGSSPRCM